MVLILSRCSDELVDRESKSLKRLAFPPRPRPDQGMEGLEQTEEFHTTEGLNSPAKDSSRRPTGSASVGG